jgi:hypothetical protein
MTWPGMTYMSSFPLPYLNLQDNFSGSIQIGSCLNLQRVPLTLLFNQETLSSWKSFDLLLWDLGGPDHTWPSSQCLLLSSSMGSSSGNISQGQNITHQPRTLPLHLRMSTFAYHWVPHVYVSLVSIEPTPLISFNSWVTSSSFLPSYLQLPGCPFPSRGALCLAIQGVCYW